VIPAGSALTLSALRGTDGPPVDDGDEIPEMIEELWDGEKSWLGKIIEVARSESPDGDVIITLPSQCFMGTATDGSRSQDVAIPLSLVRWVAARYPQGGGQSEGSSS